MRIDLSVEDTSQHSHIPFIAILLQASAHWKREVRLLRVHFILTLNRNLAFLDDC